VKITEVAQKNWPTFFNGKSCGSIITKMDWATVWATLSQTHLVTLIDSLHQEKYILIRSLLSFFKQFGMCLSEGCKLLFQTVWKILLFDVSPFVLQTFSFYSNSH
jgi:hypothetical protein